MKDLIKLQIFRISVSLGVLVSLLFFMVVAPSLKNANSEESADTRCDVPYTDDKAIQEPEDFKTTVKNVKKGSRSKRNKLASLLRVLKVILEEELKCSQIQETKEDVFETLEVEKEIENLNGTITETVFKDALNKSFNCNKILERITAALEKSRVFSNEKESKKNPANMVPIFRKTKDSDQSLGEDISTKPQGRCLKPTNQLKDMPPLPVAKLVVKIDPNNRQVEQSNINNVPSSQKFIIPCQKVSDILDDSYMIPKGAYYNVNPTTNLRPNVKAAEFKFQQATPMWNAVSSCKEADGTVAMLFKPTVVSLMQVYEDLLKKLTVTVLVPYYVSKFAM